jgi:O-succinylhomoserine sulfhydrylase
VERHCSNAEKIAATLDGNPAIARLVYPGLKSHPQYEIAQKQMKNGGPLICFELKGGKESAFRFMNALKIIDISNNLGNAKSLITHPASTTHHSIGAGARAKIGISDSLLRLSVGIENVDDLTGDIITALKAI